MIAAPYYGLGSVIYAAIESKPCESILKLSEPNYNPATCQEPWTLIDGLYFTTVSMSTSSALSVVPKSNVADSAAGAEAAMSVLVPVCMGLGRDASIAILYSL